MTDVAEQFQPGQWAFTEDVAEVFDEHVRASVPFYDEIQALVAEVSDWLVPAGGLVADLGASTGTTMAAILDRHPDRNIRGVLYDAQPAMLAKAVDRLSGPVGDGRVTMHARQVERGLGHIGADLTVSLFTLQFLSWQHRFDALQNARKASAGTGALIVAEKVRVVDSRWSHIATDVSHDWKAARGVSAAAIRAKSRALRGVLVPYPVDALADAVTAAGWQSPEVLFRWHQWVVLGAFASPHYG